MAALARILSLICWETFFFFFFFLYIPIKYYNTYLRSTILTIITLQYYWDEHPRGAKGHVYPKGFNIDK